MLAAGRDNLSEVRGLSVSVEIRPAAPETDSDEPWWDVSDWFDQYGDSHPDPAQRRTRSPTVELAHEGLDLVTDLSRWQTE